MSVTDMAGHRGSCENCNAALGRYDGCIVWYQQRQGDLNYSVGYVAVRGCAACAEEGLNAELRSRPFSLGAALRVLSGKKEPYVRDTYCERCGRAIVFVTLTKYSGPYQRIAYCSEACREAKVYAPEKVCEVCGTAFTPNRRDAKTCSVACKQKAYRQRKAKADTPARPV
jgi:hypothetical protein